MTIKPGMPPVTRYDDPKPDAASHVGQFKLWNVPQTDPFVGQPAFVVRTGTHDEIYAAYVSAIGSLDGRTFAMTDHNSTPLYAA